MICFPSDMAGIPVFLGIVRQPSDTPVSIPKGTDCRRGWRNDVGRRGMRRLVLTLAQVKPSSALGPGAAGLNSRNVSRRERVEDHGLVLRCPPCCSRLTSEYAAVRLSFMLLATDSPVAAYGAVTDRRHGIFPSDRKREIPERYARQFVRWN
jgi:hypothetical protein